MNAHNVICVNFNDYFGKDPALCLDMICQVTGEKFIFLADEWDTGTQKAVTQMLADEPVEINYDKESKRHQCIIEEIWNRG